MTQLIHATWYAAYSNAILQGDAKKVLEEVPSARAVIMTRIAELDLDPYPNHRERKQLQDALRYLTMLADCYHNEGGKLLWC